MKVCITTVVDKYYSEYIPLFEWCLSRSYPKYMVKILIKEKEFKGYNDCGFNTIALRFLTGIAPYRKYDYVYITDIDMMILPETTPLHMFHIAEMAKTGLSYSNSLRNSKHWKGDESLTGLHFCSVEWFDRVEEQAEKYRKIVRESTVRREYDGWMLYRMCRDSGIELPGKYPLVPRHHGIHLGNFRLFDGNKKKLIKRMDEKKCRIWMEYTSDPEYKKIVGSIKNATIRLQLDQLQNHCRGMLCR